MGQKCEILTSRLKLQALTEDHLRSYLQNSGEYLVELGEVSRKILTPILDRAITLKLEKFPGTDPADLPWITYWLIRVPPDEFGAGMIGFKGPPDSLGEVEVGYGIDPDYRRMGYTTEALLGMVDWAFSDPRCQRIVAPGTLRTNPASNRVLQKAGFQIYAENEESISWSLDKLNRGELDG